MSTRTQLVVAIAVGQVVGLLGYIDPLFFPLVLAGPLIVGRCCGRPRHLDESRRRGLGQCRPQHDRHGLGALREDVVFHLVLTVVMSLLAMAGHAAVRLIASRREGRDQMVA